MSEGEGIVPVGLRREVTAEKATVVGIAELREGLGLAKESPFLISVDEREQRAQELLEQIIAERKERYKGGIEYSSQNRADYEFRMEVRKSKKKGFSERMPEVLSALGRDDARDHLEVLRTSGVNIDAGWARPGVLKGLSQIGPEELQIAIERMSYLSSSSVNRAMFGNSESMQFLKDLSEIKEEEFEGIVAEIDKFGDLFNPYALLDYSTGELEPQMQLIAEAVSEGGWSEDVKRKLNGYRKISLLHSTQSWISTFVVPVRNEHGQVMSFGEYAESREKGEVTFGISDLLKVALEPEELEQIVRLEALQAYEREDMGGMNMENFVPFDSKFMAQIVEENLSNEITDLGGIDVVPTRYMSDILSGSYVKGGFHLKFDIENVKKKIEIYKDLMTEQEKVERAGMLLELAGDDADMHKMSESVLLLEKLDEQREGMANYLSFVASLPRHERVEPFEVQGAIDISSEGKIFVDHDRVSRYVSAINATIELEAGWRVEFGEAEGISREDHEYSKAIERLYTSLYSVRGQVDAAFGKDYAVLGYLANNKDRISEIISPKDSTNVVASTEVIEAMLRGEIEVEQDTLEWWFEHNWRIDPALFMEHRSKLVIPKQRFYLFHNSDDFLEKTQIEDKEEREYWGLVLGILQGSSSATGANKSIADSLLEQYDRRDEYIKDGKITFEFVEEVIDDIDEIIGHSQSGPIYELIDLLGSGEVEITDETDRQFVEFFLAKVGWRSDVEAFTLKKEGFIKDFFQLLKENRDEFGEIVQNGEVTEKFMNIILNSYSNAWSYHHPNMAEMLTDEAIGEFSEEGKEFWGEWRKYGRIAQGTLITEKLKEDFEIREYIGTDGVLTKKLLDKVSLATRGVKESLDMIHDYEMMDRMSEADKRYWQVIRRIVLKESEYRMELSHVLANNMNVKEGREEYFTEAGTLSVKFFEKLIQHDTNNVTTDLLSDEVLAEFPEEEKVYWSFLRGKSMMLIKAMTDDVTRQCVRENVSKDLEVKPKLLFSLAMQGNKKYAGAYALLLKEYVGKVEEGKLDQELVSLYIDKAFISHEGNLGLMENLVEKTPSLKVKVEEWKEESKKEEYQDLVSERDIYWTLRSPHAVIMHHFGLDVEGMNFAGFDRLARSENFKKALDMKKVSLYDVQKLIEEVKLDARNWKYFSPELFAPVTSEIVVERGKASFYARLLGQKPGAFNSTAASIVAAGIDVGDSKVEERIFEAIEKLSVVTPTILNNYVMEEDPDRRREFIEKCKEMRKVIYTNVPVKDYFGDDRDGRTILVEFINMSYPGTTLSNVEASLVRVEDRSGDLSGFKINEEGYKAEIESVVKKAVLKEGEEIDREFLFSVRGMFPKSLSEEDVIRFKREMGKSIGTFIKRVGALDEQNIIEDTASILSILYEDEVVAGFRNIELDIDSEDSVSVFLGRAQELLGVYFKDNFEDRLGEVLSSDAELQARVSSMLKNRKRVDQFRRNFGKLTGEEQERFGRYLDEIEAHQESDEDIPVTALAGFLGITIENRVLAGKNGLRTRVKRENRKFDYLDEAGEEVSAKTVAFRGYVSKNVASYFAKTTAGLCTADDQELFNREEHFHINLVDDQEELAVGNIQGYVIEYQGRKALLMRGFNPSTSVVEMTNADAWCEGMVSVVRRFVEDNSDKIAMEDVFVSEQLGHYHALTNRSGEGVHDWFKGRILKEDREVEFDYSITASSRINKMYRLF